MIIVGVVLAAIFLTGCIVLPPGTDLSGLAARPKMTIAQAEEVSQGMRTSKGRSEFVSSCMSKQTSDADHEMAALLLNVPLDQAVETMCERSADSIADGSITPAQLATMHNDNDYTPLLRAVLAKNGTNPKP